MIYFNWAYQGASQPIYFKCAHLLGKSTYFRSACLHRDSRFFLAILALSFPLDRYKQWLLMGTILSLMLSWGKNFELLTKLFVDFIPLYSKFRAVSSIQVILEFCFPVLALMGLRDVLQADVKVRAQRFNVQLWVVWVFYSRCTYFKVLCRLRARMMPTTANFLVHK